MKSFLNLKFYYILYNILILIVFVFSAKFIFDFCLMNQDITKNDYNNVEKSKFIIKPRVQGDINGFGYIEADKGYEENHNYFFENVNMSGDFGNINSGLLEIKDDKNIFEFTKNPIFILNIENIEKQQ